MTARRDVKPFFVGKVTAASVAQKPVLAVQKKDVKTGVKSQK
jgi:hypothetical protein